MHPQCRTLSEPQEAPNLLFANNLHNHRQTLVRMLWRKGHRCCVMASACSRYTKRLARQPSHRLPHRSGKARPSDRRALSNEAGRYESRPIGRDVTDRSTQCANRAAAVELSPGPISACSAYEAARPHLKLRTRPTKGRGGLSALIRRSVFRPTAEEETG